MGVLPAIIWFKSADSTNNLSSALLPHLDNLSVVAAWRQSRGRGQGDHVWSSREGCNLTFTFVVRFAEGLPCSELHLLTCAATHALTLYLSAKGVDARIKLPNDIYVDGRKICGLLIENTLEGKRVASSLIGVGLNLNQTDFPPELPNPVSLSMLSGRSYDLQEELQELGDMLKKSVSLLDTAEGRNVLKSHFEARRLKPSGDL